MEADEVVRLLNTHAGRHLRLVGRLGGEAVGAWEVVDDRLGNKEVLKYSTEWGWASHFSRVGMVNVHLRAHGYPTPAVIGSGVLPGWVSYYLQDLAAGDRLGEQGPDVRPSDRAVELMLELNRLQQGLAPPLRGPNWSDYIEDCLWNDRHEWPVLAQLGHPAITDFLESARGFLGARPSQAFSREDLVTGSFVPSSVLVVGERVSAMVDLDAAGSGDRVIDLGILAHLVESDDQRARIAEEAERVDRVWVLQVATLYWYLSSLHLAVGDGHDPDTAARRATEGLEHLTR